MKIGVTLIPPLWFATLRIALGAITLFAVLAATGALKRPGRADLPAILAVGFLHMAVFLGCVNLALLYVGAGRSAVLAYTTPLWVVPAAVLFLGERLDLLKAVGLLIGFLGILTLFNPAAMDWSEPTAILGNGLLILAAFAWAGAIVQVRAHRWESTPLQLAPWQMLVALPILAIVAFVVEGIPEVSWSPKLGWILAYNGPLATAFCFWAATTVARDLPAITTSLGFFGVPMAGILFSGLILGEPLEFSLGLGLASLILGLTLVNLSDSRRAKQVGGGAKP